MSIKHLSKDSACPPDTKDTMRFYTMRFCPFAQRVSLVASAKNIPLQPVYINLHSKPSWFLEKNSCGKVPCLEINGKRVTESLICSQYLDDLYPNKKLTPQDPFIKAENSMLIEHFGKFTGLIATLKQNYSEDTVKTCLDLLKPFEEFLDEKKTVFFGGNELGMVDLMIWPWFERIPSFAVMGKKFEISEDKFPNLYKWQTRMKEQPVVQKNAININHYVNFLKSLSSGNPIYDPEN